MMFDFMDREVYSEGKFVGLLCQHHSKWHIILDGVPSRTFKTKKTLLEVLPEMI